MKPESKGIKGSKDQRNRGEEQRKKLSGSFKNAFVRVVFWSRRLTIPGPAISVFWMSSLSGRFLMIFSAISLGFTFIPFAFSIWNATVVNNSGKSVSVSTVLRSHLGHGHGAVALVVSELGLLVGRQGHGSVFQFWERRPDGQAEHLLEPLVDVDHGEAAAGLLLLQRLRTDARRSGSRGGDHRGRWGKKTGRVPLTLFRMLKRYFSLEFSSVSSSKRAEDPGLWELFRLEISAERFWI